MTKIFLFPQNMVRADVLDGFFGGLYRCGSAASGGLLKTVRAISRILHHLGIGKLFGAAPPASATSSYCIFGAKTNWRFRLGKENF
jgi:hypothetical protein